MATAVGNATLIEATAGELAVAAHQRREMGARFEYPHRVRVLLRDSGLNEWFPGEPWQIISIGDRRSYYDLIVEAADSSFVLGLGRNPHTRQVDVALITDLDRLEGGIRVNSAADIGRILATGRATP